MRPAGTEGNLLYDAPPVASQSPPPRARGRASTRGYPREAAPLKSSRGLTLEMDGMHRPLNPLPAPSLHSVAMDSDSDSDATDDYQFEDVRESIPRTSPQPPATAEAAAQSPPSSPVWILCSSPDLDVPGSEKLPPHPELSTSTLDLPTSLSGQDDVQTPPSSPSSETDSVVPVSSLNTISQDQLYTIPAELSFEQEYPAALPQEFMTLYQTLMNEVQQATNSTASFDLNHALLQLATFRSTADALHSRNRLLLQMYAFHAQMLCTGGNIYSTVLQCFDQTHE